MLEAYLRDLEREFARTLPPEDVQARLAEVAAHLDEDVQARRELGLSPDEAEREAVAAFGSARTIVREIRRREPRFDPAFAGAALGLVAFFALAFNVVGVSSAWWLVPYVALHGVLIVRSLVVRRPQLPTLALLILPLWIGTAAFLSTRYVSYRVADAPWRSTVRRIDLGPEIRRTEAESANALAAPGRMLGDYARYVRRESDLAPGRVAAFREGWRLKLVRQPDRTRGEAHWRNALTHGAAMATRIADEQAQTARNLRDAARRPWWRELPYQLGFADEKSAVAMAAATYGGLHLLLWAFGAAWRGTRGRRRRPPTAA